MIFRLWRWEIELRRRPVELEFQSPSFSGFPVHQVAEPDPYFGSYEVALHRRLQRLRFGGRFFDPLTARRQFDEDWVLAGYEIPLLPPVEHDDERGL